MRQPRLCALVLLLCLVPLAAPAEDRGAEAFARLLALTEVGAQTDWGLRYEHGEGVTRDYDRAVRLYCRAGWRGDGRAQYQLGWMYANGRGVGRDDALAAAWFRLAAGQGDPDARRMLARLVDPAAEPAPARCVRPGGAEELLLAAGDASATRRQVTRLVQTLAPEYGLEPDLVLALVQTESDFDPKAVSPKQARGLMQLMPATARRFGVTDILDPVQNLRGGMAYLRWLLGHFKGDLRLALAGYNAGEGAVERYRGVPPYAETQRYVRRVIQRYGRDVHPPTTEVVQADGDPSGPARKG